MRILLIEDDPLIGDGIKEGLSEQCISVDWITDGALAKDALASTSYYDAVVLDLVLPGTDGLDILRHWRRTGQKVPVLVLTARASLDERVEGLDLGADDYLGKPFSLKELTARLQALVRRSRGEASPYLEHGNLRLDTASRTLYYKGESISLSSRELRLLEILVQHRRQTLSKSFLENKLYAWGEEVCSNTIEVHIHHLRRKLGKDVIRTIHGIGYTLGET